MGECYMLYHHRVPSGTWMAEVRLAGMWGAWPCFGCAVLSQILLRWHPESHSQTVQWESLRNARNAYCHIKIHPGLYVLPSDSARSAEEGRGDEQGRSRELQGGHPDRHLLLGILRAGFWLQGGGEGDGDGDNGGRHWGHQVGYPQ